MESIRWFGRARQKGCGRKVNVTSGRVATGVGARCVGEGMGGYDVEVYIY